MSAWQGWVVTIGVVWLLVLRLRIGFIWWRQNRRRDLAEAIRTGVREGLAAAEIGRWTYTLATLMNAASATAARLYDRDK